MYDTISVRPKQGYTLSHLEQFTLCISSMLPGWK